MLRFFMGLFIILSSFAEGAVYWTPPITLNLNPPVPINSLTGSYQSGNAVITWQDQNSQNYLTSFFTVGSNNWTPSEILTSEAVFGAPSVAINGAGTAVAAWTEGSQLIIDAAIHEGNGWIPLPAIATAGSGETFNPPLIGIDPSGNILAVYSTNIGNTTTLFGAVFNGITWISTPLNSAINLTVPPQPTLGYDAKGNAVIGWGFFDGTNASIDVANYTKSSQTFLVTPLALNEPADGGFISGNPNFVQVAVNDSGKAVAVWTLGGGGIYASNYNGGWSSATTLTPSVQTNNPASVAINNNGMALVAYGTNQPPYQVIAASFDGTVWTSTVAANSPFFILQLSVGLDPFGNGIIGWDNFDFGTLTSTIFASSRVGLGGSWTTNTVTTAPTGNVAVAFVTPILPSGETLFIYGEGPFNGNLSLSSFSVTYGVNLFPPQPANQLRGALIKNKFLFQTDFVHQLTWIPSPDPAVLSYLITRNGILIGSVPGSGPFVFDDHNRTKGERDLYTLTSTNGTGLLSESISLVFQ